VTSFVHKPIETKKLIDSMSNVVEKIKKNKTIETKSFTVTVPMDIYEMVNESAKDERISKNGIIIRALKEHFGK
jgi:YesN/AraC family two-component response regulator